MIALFIVSFLLGWFIQDLFNFSIEKNTETGEYLLFYSIPFSKFVKRKYIKLF